MQAVLIARGEPTADASFAAIFERSRLGMAIAAMIRMIATTIRSSMSEKPFCLFRMESPSEVYSLSRRTSLTMANPLSMRGDERGTTVYYHFGYRTTD